jgi:hypothetical protein
MKRHFFYLLCLFVMSSSVNANAGYAEPVRCQSSKYAVGDSLPNNEPVIAEWSIWKSGKALGVVYQAGYANQRYVVAFHSMPARMRQQLGLKRLVKSSDPGSVTLLRALPHGVELKNC